MVCVAVSVTMLSMWHSTLTSQAALLAQLPLAAARRFLAAVVREYLASGDSGLVSVDPVLMSGSPADGLAWMGAFVTLLLSRYPELRAQLVAVVMSALQRPDTPSQAAVNPARLWTLAALCLDDSWSGALSATETDLVGLVVPRLAAAIVKDTSGFAPALAAWLRWYFSHQKAASAGVALFAALLQRLPGNDVIAESRTESATPPVIAGRLRFRVGVCGLVFVGVLPNCWLVFVCLPHV